MNRPTDTEVQAMLREYLELAETHRTTTGEAKRATETAKRCADRMLHIRTIVEQTVSPVCGSAAQPVIRTFTNGRYQTVSVFWDGRKGRIAITSNDVGPDASEALRGKEGA